MTTPQVLMTGISFGESPRWHDGRLWFADWGAGELIAVDSGGASEVVARIDSFPFCIDWLPDGRLLVVSAADQAVLRQEPDGSFVRHADLSGLSQHPGTRSPSTAAATPTSTTSASTWRAESSPRGPSRS